MAKFSVTGQLTVYNMNDVLASLTPPPKPTEGALWLNAKDNQLYVYVKGSWVISADYKNWVNSKGDNLVSNGSGSLGDNSNFSTFEFDPSDSYSGGGSFKDTAYNTNRFSDEIIPIDISKTYRLSVWGKTNPAVGAKHFIGVAEFDSDGLLIDSGHHMYLKSTLSSLTQDLKNGDTVVYLDNVTNWVNTNTQTYQRRMIFWNYVSKGGYKYQPLTYSRNTSADDAWADGSINTTNKTITLRTPWNRGLVAAGTKVSQGNQGSTYKYIALANGVIPNVWTKYTGTIGGLDNSGDSVQNAFSWGTAGVKMLFLNNRDVQGSTVWYSNISFGLNVADQGDVDKINDSLDALGSDGKITRFERSLVRGYIADIVGKFLNPTDAMPTLAQIDADTYNAGKLYAVRRMARKLGMNLATSPNYKPLGDAYTALVTYLSGLTPVKPWDTSSSATISIDRTVWNTKWNDYYNRYALFEIEVQDRQKEITENAVQEMKKDTIAAISATGNYDRATFANPMTVKPPISTLGLPEFEGYHADSWYVNGRNVLAGTGTPKTMVGENRDNQTSTIYTFVAGNSAPITGVGEFTVMFDWSVEGDAPAGTMYMQGSNPYPGITSSITFSSSNRSGRYIGTNSIAGTVATFNGINMRCNFLVGKLTISNMKIAVGKHTANPVYTPAPEEAWAGVGNRFRPVTNPLFSCGTDLTIWGKFYGDGTNNDSFAWDTNGNAVKTKQWFDVYLNDKQNWEYSADYTGYKRVKAVGFTYSTGVSGSLIGVKHNAGVLTYDGNVAGRDQIALNVTDNWLYVTINDSDSGWGETYVPTKEEINAYFLGWKMCNGTFGTNYSGTGMKRWHPIGDKDLSRAPVAGNTAPTDPSPSISDKSINYYQVIYRIKDPIQETVEFDGILELLGDKDNVVTTYYPTWTPALSKGSIKYGINLATVNQDTRYIIPSMVKRIANAEQKITDESITNTVFSSREYTLALKSKANASDLGNLASKDELNNVSGAVDGKIKDAMDKLDFSPYATKSELKQTATDITAKFSATGGMNLIKNSIGYSDRDFWSLTTAYAVDTISNSALDNLGFGKGFYFRANGQETGIYQDVSVIPGQPYTLGWYLNKMTKGGDTSYRFWIQVQEYNGTAWVVPVGNQIADNSNQTTNGFEARYMTFTPTKDKVRIRFIGYANVEAIVSGIMLNIGDVALQWTLATGELYNTNIRMNINGIRVSQLDGNGSEVGYTQITPSEFAGYYQNNGTFEKVFYLNGDETVTKKLRATNEITLGNIKILSIQSSTATGWAFVPNNS